MPSGEGSAERYRRLKMGNPESSKRDHFRPDPVPFDRPLTVRTMALLRGHTLFRRRLPVQLAQEKNHMRNPMLNESLQRTAGLRFTQFGAQWPAAAEKV
jgi:hypothetical protein